jgi:hypothetical protein
MYGPLTRSAIRGVLGSVGDSHVAELLLAAMFTASCLRPDAFAAKLLAYRAKNAVNLQDDGTLKKNSFAQEQHKVAS